MECGKWKAYGSHSMSEWLIVRPERAELANWPDDDWNHSSKSSPMGKAQALLCGRKKGRRHGQGAAHTFKFMCNLTLQNWVQRTQRTVGATSKRYPNPAAGVSSIRHGNRKRDLECLPDCMAWPNMPLPLRTLHRLGNSACNSATLQRQRQQCATKTTTTRTLVLPA